MNGSTEYYTAPVTLKLKYDVQKYQEEWSYQVRMIFKFDHHDDYSIDNKILVEMGVYTFRTENEARIQAKRISKQYEEYFRDGLADLILKTVFP